MRSDLKQLYSAKFNPPDPNSEDAKKVLAWLVAQGAPSTYELIPLNVAYVDIVTREWQILWTKKSTTGGEDENFMDGLDSTMNEPAIALVELKRAFQFGNVNDIVNYPVEAAPPPPPPPPPAPITNPIGFALQAPWGVYYTTATDSAGIAYQPKDKETFTDARGTFTAHRYAVLGNAYGAYWYLPGFALGAGDTPKA